MRNLSLCTQKVKKKIPEKNVTSGGEPHSIVGMSQPYNVTRRSSDASGAMGGLAQGPSQCNIQLPGVPQLSEPVAAGRALRAGSPIRYSASEHEDYAVHREYREAVAQERDLMQSVFGPDLDDVVPQAPPMYREMTGRRDDHVVAPANVEAVSDEEPTGQPSQGASHGPPRAPPQLPGNGQLVTGEERDIVLRALCPNLQTTMKTKRPPNISVDMVLKQAREDPDFRQVWGDILHRKRCDNAQGVAALRSILRSALRPRKCKSRN